ncbi:MAG: methyltransferase domain-containing protein [Candidatus Brocadiia bacterium]
MHVELLDLLRCPACHGELRARADALLCPACDRAYELVHGVPDFRDHPPDRPRHGEVCRKVMDLWPTRSYRELWSLLHPDRPDELDRLWLEHEERAPARGERRYEAIARTARALGVALRPRGVALDVGCGMGSAVFALARRARLAVGLDILLTDLLLARKRFAEAGLDNVAFVCASATALPLREGAVDLANATDVIEHLPDPRAFLAEAQRALRPGGALFLNSPNRFTVLTREPHVRLWGVGWLPRRWMEPYVRWRRGRAYRGKRLLSVFELRRLLRQTFGGSWAIRAFVPRAGLGGLLRRVLGAVAKPVLPQHHVLAWKPPPPDEWEA